MNNLKLFFLIICGCMVAGCHHTAQPTEKNGTDQELETLRKNLARHPKDAKCCIELSEYFMERGLVDSAMNYALKAVRLDSLNADYYVTLSDLYLLSNQTDLCEDMLLKALQVNDKCEAAYLKLAELHYLFKRYDESLEMISKALELNDYLPKAYFIRGWVMREQGDTNAAIRAYLKAVDQNSSYYQAYEELAHLYHLRHHPLAVEYYKNVLSIQPDHLQTLYNLAMFYQETGDYDQALVQYRTILRIDPVNKFAMNNMGWVYLAQEKI